MLACFWVACRGRAVLRYLPLSCCSESRFLVRPFPEGRCRHDDLIAQENRPGIARSLHQSRVELVGVCPKGLVVGCQPQTSTDGEGQVRRNHGHAARRVLHEANEWSEAPDQAGVPQAFPGRPHAERGIRRLPPAIAGSVGRSDRNSQSGTAPGPGRNRPSDPAIQGADPEAAPSDAHLLRAIGQAHPDSVGCGFGASLPLHQQPRAEPGSAPLRREGWTGTVPANQGSQQPAALGTCPGWRLRPPGTGDCRQPGLDVSRRPVLESLLLPGDPGGGGGGPAGRRRGGVPERAREPGATGRQRAQGAALRRRCQAPGGARYAQGTGEVVDAATQDRSGRRLFLQSLSGAQRPTPTEDKR